MERKWGEGAGSIYNIESETSTVQIKNVKKEPWSGCLLAPRGDH